MLEVRTAVVMNGLVVVGHGKSEIPLSMPRRSGNVNVPTPARFLRSR